MNSLMSLAAAAVAASVSAAAAAFTKAALEQANFLLADPLLPTLELRRVFRRHCPCSQMPTRRRVSGGNKRLH